ncbi:hypothetical protein ACS0TY_025935 [Phlomoides rotata]
MVLPLLSPAAAAAAAGGALLSSTYHCSLKFVHPVPPLFSKRRPTFSLSRLLKPITLANAAESSSGGTSTKPATTHPSSSAGPISNSDPISFVGQENVPLEGVIQFEKPNSSALLAKWGYVFNSCFVGVFFVLMFDRNCSLVALLAGGDVAALLLFAAIGRFSHGLSVYDFETFKIADPFIAGWFLSAYFLGGFSDEGKGKKGLWSAVAAATKSWSLGIPVRRFHSADSSCDPSFQFLYTERTNE